MDIMQIKDKMKNMETFEIPLENKEMEEPEVRLLREYLKDTLLHYHRDLLYPIYKAVEVKWAESTHSYTVEQHLQQYTRRYGYTSTDESVAVQPFLQIIPIDRPEDYTKIVSGKKFRKMMHDVFGVSMRYKYDPRFMQGMIESTREIFYPKYKTEHYMLEFSPFDKDLCAEDYYHEDSCLWGSYPQARVFLSSNDAYAILEYRLDDDVYEGRELIGRHWAMPTETGFCYFNSYTELDIIDLYTDQYPVRIKTDSVRHAKSTQLESRGTYVFSKDTDKKGSLVRFSDEYTSEDIPEGLDVCSECGYLVDEYEGTSVYDGIVCEDCLATYYEWDELNEEYVHESNMIDYINENGDWRRTNENYLDYHDIYTCDSCDDYFHMDLLDDNNLCENCRPEEEEEEDE